MMMLIVTMSIVAPHTGAWIETSDNGIISLDKKSHPTRVRGLKPVQLALWPLARVAPHTGAWIETIWKVKAIEKIGRTPHGCVD